MFLLALLGLRSNPSVSIAMQSIIAKRGDNGAPICQSKSVVNDLSTDRVASAGPQQTGVLPFALLFVLGLGFGVSFTLNKLATTNGVPFIPYVFWQSAGAALRQLPAVTGAHIRIFVVMALLNVVIPYLVLSYVAPKLPIGLALIPGVIYLMALALRLESFALVRFSGICLGLVGVLVILLPKASLPEPGIAGWLALSLVATPAFSLRAVLVPLMRPPATTSLSLACGLLIAAAIIMLIVIALGMLVFGERNSIWVWLVIALMLVGLYLVNRGKAR